MKAFVDPDLCIGCGICEQVCSAVFSMTDDNIAIAIDVKIGIADFDNVNSAKDQCPVEAISIEE